jgi:hypothetical protein
LLTSDKPEDSAFIGLIEKSDKLEKRRFIEINRDLLRLGRILKDQQNDSILNAIASKTEFLFLFRLLEK